MARARRAVDRRVGAALALALASGASWALPGREEDTRRQPADTPIGTGFSGRDFGGQMLPLAPARGPLNFRASRAYSWTEADGPSPTQRLLLTGDVQVRIGTHRFTANQAVVWLQKIGAGSTPASGGVWQVFLYFEDVGTPESDAAISLQAARLPVRAVLDVDGVIRLERDSLQRVRPVDPLVTEGEAALARALEAQVRPPARSSDDTEPGLTRRPGAVEHFEPAQETRERTIDDEIRDLATKLPPLEAAQPIFAKRGILSVSPGDWTLVSGETENAAEVTGGLVVQYQDLESDDSLQLVAQRGVIFLKPGPLEQIGRLSRQDVFGVYLEGDVTVSANNGKYSLRGPRVYYDFVKGRAVVLDAVFWTYDQKRRLPLYLRAQTIRQEAKQQFTAEKASLTNSAFLDPQFSIGATTLTITGVQRGASPETSYLVDARNLTLRTNNIPFFYWPYYKGFPEDIPLRDLRVENSSGSGSALKTAWSLQGLLGIERTDRFGADLLLDYYFDRGVGLGSEMSWDGPDGQGNLFVYGLPSDRGRDVLKPGTKIDRKNETRDILLAEHRVELDENWTLWLEGAFISDEAFVDAFFRPWSETRREFTTRAYARRAEENSAFSVEVKGTFNDFIANEYLLQTPGYAVQKLPELKYVRLADDVLGGIDPGLVSWFQEYRYSHLQLAFDEPTASERGYTNDFLSRRAFGIGRNESIGDLLRAGGYTEDGVHRFDTRQELAAPLAVGPVNVTPFTVGRFTAYDDDFSRFSPNEEDNARVWGGVGARVSATIQRVDNTVQSRLFDLNRVRHIVEPYATLWHAGTNVDRVNLPIYDEEVEGIAEGSTARFGVSQTWQTQRGGPGRWRSADVLKLDSNVVFTSGDADRESPIGRFIEFRPELSNPGNYLTNEAVWQVSDTFALTGSSIYDLDRGQQQRSSVGFIIDHWPGFYTDAEIRNLHPERTTYLTAGAGYELSSKYTVYANATFDLNNGGFQYTSAEIRRRFPGITLGFGASYNNITSETSFGFVLQPEGIRKGARISGLGGDSDRVSGGAN